VSSKIDQLIGENFSTLGADWRDQVVVSVATKVSKAYLMDVMKKLDEHGFINQEMKDTYGFDQTMVDHLYHVKESKS